MNVFLRVIFIFSWATVPTFSKINFIQSCLQMPFSGPREENDLFTGMDNLIKSITAFTVFLNTFSFEKFYSNEPDQVLFLRMRFYSAVSLYTVWTAVPKVQSVGVLQQDS